VDVFLGEATLESPRAVRAGDAVLKTRHIVLATGSRAAVPDIPGLKEAGYETNETIFERESAPGRLLVLGGGPIGCELAQAMARLGARVTLVDRGTQLLHREDSEVAALLQAQLESDGVRLLLRARVESVVPGRGVPHRVKVRQHAEGGRAAGGPIELDADTILVAAGRRPNVEGLGLEKAGVAYAEKGVTIDAHLATTQKNIYAGGRTSAAHTGSPTSPSTRRASSCATSPVAAARSGTRPGRLPRRAVDDVHRAGGGAGRPEREGGRAGRRAVRRASLPVLRAGPRRPGERGDRLRQGGRRERQGTILGATVVGAGAGELIHEIALAMQGGIGLATLSSMIHVYPTLSQAVQRTADAYMKTRLTDRARAIFSRLYAWQRRRA